MASHFRDHHPMGSIVTELLRIEEGIHYVRAQIVVNSTILGTGIAGSTTVEEAEDAALKRALTHAGFNRSGFSSTGSLSGTGSLPSFAAPSPPPFVPPPARDPLPSTSNGQSAWDPPTPSLPTPSPSSAPVTASSEPDDGEDLSEIIAHTDVEMRRAGWGRNEGQDYLFRTFGKKSRHQLDGPELREFLIHLQQQPTRG